MRQIILAVFGFLLLASCTALMLGGTSGNSNPPGNSPRSSSSPASGDSGLAADVRRELESSTQLSASGIVVDGRAGRITLRGTVGSYAERQRAGEIAGNVQSVLAVDNRLKVVAHQ